MDFSLFEQQMVWQQGLLLSLFLYSLYILFDFSGYSDIAIGTAYLIGIKIPENFDNPYGSKSLSVFWKKWHMTFSNFLFKYVFKPFVVSLSGRFKKLPRLAGSSIGYIFTFIICGIWHGNTINFIYWGLWHGIGLILFKIWDIYVFKPKIAPALNRVSKFIYNVGAISITFIFVTIGWFFFNYQHTDVHLITKNLTQKIDSRIEVNPVIYDGSHCFQIQFIPDDSTYEVVDIEYEVAAYNQTFKFYGVKANPKNLYHVLIEGTGNQLVSFKIRSRHDNFEGQWHSLVTYSRLNKFTQSDLQTSIFGNYRNPIRKITNVDTLLGKALYLTDEYKAQALTSKAKLFNGFGWGIETNYLSFKGRHVAIEYQHNNGEWVSYSSKREGQYDYIHIHGKEEFDNTGRNLKPGEYMIRIKYFTGAKSSIWLYDSVTVPDYVNH